MRRSFDGLAELVRQVIRQDPLQGDHLFVFRGRRGDKVKILYWDRGGYCLWYKRLETGVFHFPSSGRGSVEMEAVDLMFILEGIDLTGARRRERYAPRAGGRWRA